MKQPIVVIILAVLASPASAYKVVCNPAVTANCAVGQQQAPRPLRECGSKFWVILEILSGRRSCSPESSCCDLDIPPTTGSEADSRLPALAVWEKFGGRE